MPNSSTAKASKHPDFSTVRTAAQGRWRDILTRLGIDEGYLKNRHGPCPGCGGQDRFRFDDRDGRGTWICGGGGDEKAGDGFQLLEHVFGYSRAESLKAVAEVLGLVDGVPSLPPRKASPPDLAKEDEKRKRKRQQAAELARRVIESAPLAKPTHRYLLNKRLPYSPNESTPPHPFQTLHQLPIDKLRRLIGYRPKADGEPLEGDVLIAPVGDWNGITTLEMIDGDGRKSALKGGRKAGRYWAAQPMPEDPPHLLIGEGIATVLSAIEATGWPGVAALSCGNLPKVAQAMRQRYPKATITILADLGNGQTMAIDAARAIDGHLAIPDFGENRHEKQTDFNDLALCRGLETVKDQIMEAITQSNPVTAELSEFIGLPVIESDLTDPRPEVLDKVRAELEARIDKAEKEAAQARRDWRALVQAQPLDRREWRILYRLAKRHLAGGAIRSADAKVMGLGKRELTDLIDRLAKSRQAFRRCQGIAARLKATTPEDDWQRRVSLVRERQTEGKPPGTVGPDRPDAKHTAPSSAEKKHPLDGKKVGCYRVLSGRLYREVEKGDAVHTIAVANFAAHIGREVRRTDGLETRFLFEIEGWLGTGEPLPRALVTAKEFSGLNWICEHWGSRAMVYPGQAAKDHCRAAIQMMSDPERATIYAHLGWTEIDGKPVFIHAGGGIGADGVVAGIEVDPSTALAGFVLPEPPTPDEVADLIRDVLDLPGTLAPDAIVWPLLLYTLGAPLGHSPFSLYLAGGSGARKTSLALVAQSFFGYRDAEPPISWEATANALEGAAFAAKDVALLVDDFAPTGDARAREELKRKAARVLRSQGNKTGRLRMRADGTLAGDRPPRGSLIVTGEDLPPGHSVRARCLFIEVKPEDTKRGIPGDVDLHRLTEAQRMARAGRYARLMATWIRWLAPRLTETRKRLRERIESLRPQWASVHGRTTDAVARLQAVWELFAEFAVEAGAVTQAELEAHQARILDALKVVAEAQASIQKNTDPAERFAELLQSLLSSGRAHLLDKNDETAPPDDPGKWGWRAIQGDGLATATPWQPQGRAIGWVDENNVYLDPQAAYAELDRLAGETGEPLPSSRSLWKRLSERGLLRTGIEKGKTRYTVKETCGGKRPRVAIFPVATLYVPESGASGAGGTNPHGSNPDISSIRGRHNLRDPIKSGF